MCRTVVDWIFWWGSVEMFTPLSVRRKTNVEGRNNMVVKLFGGYFLHLLCRHRLVSSSGTSEITLWSGDLSYTYSRYCRTFV